MLGLAQHQRYGSALLDAVGSLGLFFGCGCGKTATVLDWVYRHVQTGEFGAVLVVCPASLQDAWRLSIDRMSEFEGYTQEGIDAVREAVTIRSYQGISTRVSKTIRHRNGTTTSKYRYRLRSDVNHEWNAVIVDESHALGSHSSVQTEMCLELAKLADHRVAMSGTPVTGGKDRADWSKLYGQANFIEPGTFRTWTEFKRSCVRSCDPWGKPSSYNEDVCEDIITSLGIFVRLDDVFDMPECISTDIPVGLTPTASRAYQDILKGRWIEHGVDIRVAGAQYGKLFQVCSGFLYRDDRTVEVLGSPKDNALKTVITATDGRVVVFARYRWTIDHLCELLPDAVRFDATSKGPTWKEFQYGEARILITQYACGNAGLDLYASHTMVFYEPTLSALQLDQAQDRIHRKGQTHACRYYFLYAQGTYEEKAVRSIRSGVDVTRSLMKGWAENL